MESRQLRSNKYKRVYKEPSDEDPYLEILNISDIHERTSEWNKDDYQSLNIFFEDAITINEMILQTNELNEPYSSLVLKGWNRNDFLITANKEDYKNKKIFNRWVITIVRKISAIVAAEVAQSNKEDKIDSFMLSLLTYLQFDLDPLLIHPQYAYTIKFTNNHHISSIVEYMITRKHENGYHIILFIEDKHNDNVSELRNWEEPQIAGEIFGSAHHNGSLYRRGIKKYPFTLYAVRVIGTKFTFYKSTITRGYLEECQTGYLPKKNKMIIKRFPQNSDPYVNAWDFCEENDRICILKMLKSIEEESINMEI